MKIRVSCMQLISNLANVDESEANKLFIESGKSVKLAIIMSITGKTKEEASLALTKTEGHMKKAIDLLNKEEK